MDKNVLRNHTSLVLTASFKMEALYSSSALVPMYQTTECCQSEDHIMNLRRYGNVKSTKSLLLTEHNLYRKMIYVVEVKQFISASQELNVHFLF